MTLGKPSSNVSLPTYYVPRGLSIGLGSSNQVKTKPAVVKSFEKKLPMNQRQEAMPASFMTTKVRTYRMAHDGIGIKAFSK